MIDRIVTIGGTLGFVLLLLFGRDLIGFFQQPSEPASQTAVVPTNDDPVREAQRLSQVLTARLRQDLVAIAREEMQIERLAKTTSKSTLLARTQRLAKAQRQLDSLLVANDRLLAALRTADATLPKQANVMVTSIVHGPAEFDHTATLRSLVNEIEAQLTSTELHFMEEVLPVVHQSPTSSSSMDLAKVDENTLAPGSVGQTVEVALPAEGGLPHSVFFEGAARKNDIVGNAY